MLTCMLAEYVILIVELFSFFTTNSPDHEKSFFGSSLHSKIIQNSISILKKNLREIKGGNNEVEVEENYQDLVS